MARRVSARSVRLISAVSGGSAGAMNVMAASANCGPPLDPASPHDFDANAASRESSLHAAGWGLVFKDSATHHRAIFLQPIRRSRLRARGRLEAGGSAEAAVPGRIAAAGVVAHATCRSSCAPVSSTTRWPPRPASRCCFQPSRCHEPLQPFDFLRTISGTRCAGLHRGAVVGRLSVRLTRDARGRRRSQERVYAPRGWRLFRQLRGQHAVAA